MTSPLEAALRAHHRPHQATRTAAASAAFFLPLLRPGMALLDIGCGPGTITVGLAEAIAPGVATGVDIAPAAVPEPVLVVEASAYDLPFPDASFDAIFSHATLQHLSDPLAALREARRVAKPGAVIGVRDADWDGQLLAPADPMLDRTFTILGTLRANSSPTVGKHLRGLLAAAGFTDCVASASVDYDGTVEAARGTAQGYANLLGRPGLVETVIRQGISSAEELREIVEAWRRWAEQPGAFLARFWCEATGRAD
jgi:SAM-dependent methyltransferase